MNKQDIWTYAQNKPTLIVDDLKDYAPKDVVYESLLRRGVFKWPAVRRKLIELKDVWKRRITASYDQQKAADAYHKMYWRGYRKALEECRAEVRALCHGPRWDCPDFDSKAQQWLEQYEQQQREV